MRNKTLCWAAGLWCAAILTAPNVAAAAMRVEALRCDYRVNPLGIDTAAPRLSWTVVSSARGQSQTAYRILVADSAEALKAHRGTLWDSGKVQSDETISVVYGGTPLSSLAMCYWKVKVWDKDGVESPWSEPAQWQMGLLSESEWKAQWVGMSDRPVNLFLGDMDIAVNL